MVNIPVASRLSKIISCSATECKELQFVFICFLCRYACVITECESNKKVFAKRWKSNLGSLVRLKEKLLSVSDVRSLLLSPLVSSLGSVVFGFPFAFSSLGFTQTHNSRLFVWHTLSHTWALTDSLTAPVTVKATSHLLEHNTHNYSPPNFGPTQQWKSVMTEREFL